MTTSQKTYTFHVNGMHCNACVLMTESEVGDLPYVSRAVTSLKHSTMTVTGDFGERSQEELAQEFTAVLKPRGYTVSLEKQAKEKKFAEFKLAIPVAIAAMLLFFALQKMGLVNLIGGESVTYGTAFVIGIVASLSTCMAVVGGLLLSMSASFAKEGDKVRPQVLFHAGRLISFFILGGVIGAIGSAFALSTTATIILSVIVGLVMLVLGINLLDVFHWSRRLQPSMPKFLSRHALGVSKLNHTFTPALVGVATFFLPCGFTQSMQLYTLSTGSFMTGGLTMLSFALGTLPVLALISFSSFSVQSSSKSGVFFKTAGLIVIMFGIINLMSSLVLAGIIPPVFNF